MRIGFEAALESLLKIQRTTCLVSKPFNSSSYDAQMGPADQKGKPLATGREYWVKPCGGRVTKLPNNTDHVGISGVSGASV
jgi:hypothetical protein